MMNESNIYSTKFYFINPAENISVIIDALIRLEYETYIIPIDGIIKLFNILDESNQHVIFFSLRNRKEALEWMETAAVISRNTNKKIKLGAFTYTNMSDSLIMDFHNKGIEVISIPMVQKNSIDVVRRMVNLFDAKKRRKYIRAKALGKCMALLQKPEQQTTINAEILNISTHVFACRIKPEDQPFLDKNVYPDVFLSLKGLQIQVSAQLTGLRDEENGKIYLFTICGGGAHTQHLNGVNKIPAFIKMRLFNFIKTFLVEDIKQKLTLIGPDPSAS